MPSSKWDPHAVVWKPTPQLEVKKPGGEWRSDRFIIDSGSWKSILPYTMGRSMGYQKHPGEIHSNYVTEATGRIGYTPRMLVMKPGPGASPTTIPVAWADKGSNVRAAIGREGVFNNYQITLNESRDLIQFSPNDKSL